MQEIEIKLRVLKTQGKVRESGQVCAFNAKGPPVPIPNTEVKLCSAEDTWLETARENRSARTQKTEEFSQSFFVFIRIFYKDSLSKNCRE